MPLVTIASAISLISFSLTLQPNLFQLFQPIGGVLARPLSCPLALVQQQAKNKTTAISVSVIFIIGSYLDECRGGSPWPPVFPQFADGRPRRAAPTIIQASLSKANCFPQFSIG